MILLRLLGTGSFGNMYIKSVHNNVGALSWCAGCVAPLDLGARHCCYSPIGANRLYEMINTDAFCFRVSVSGCYVKRSRSLVYGRLMGLLTFIVFQVSTGRCVDVCGQVLYAMTFSLR